MSAPKAKATQKLPKGLPPLPPVPNGFDAWELRGWGQLGPHETRGNPWNSCSIGGEWPPSYAGSGKPSGFKGRYYILAVKKRASKPAAKKATTAKVMAKRRSIGDTIPVFVLPADAESVNAMEEQGYHAAVAASDLDANICQKIALAVLASIGIPARKKKGAK